MYENVVIQLLLGLNSFFADNFEKVMVGLDSGLCIPIVIGLALFARQNIQNTPQRLH